MSCQVFLTFVSPVLFVCLPHCTVFIFTWPVLLTLLPSRNSPVLLLRALAVLSSYFLPHLLAFGAHSLYTSWTPLLVQRHLPKNQTMVPFPCGLQIRQERKPFTQWLLNRPVPVFSMSQH